MKNLKKFMCLLCTAAMLLSMAACGGSEKETTTAAAAETTTEAAAETTAAAAEETTAAVDLSAMSNEEKAAYAKTTMKLGTKMVAEGVEGKAFQKFADLVFEYTNGEIYVEVYPSEQLGNQTTQINNTIMGSQELFVESGDAFAIFTDKFNLTSIPYLFPSYDDYWNFVAGDFGDEQAAILEANGLKLLNTDRDWVRGPDRVIGSVNKPVQTVADLQGMTYRCWDSATYMNGYKELGANPLVIAWSECYLALQQGTIESVSTTMINYYDAKFGEVCKNVSVCNEFPQELFMLINLDIYNGLTAEQQEAFHKAANDAAKFSNESLQAAWDEAVAKLKEQGCTIYEFDTAEANKTLQPYFIQMEDDGNLPEGLCALLGYR